MKDCHVNYQDFLEYAYHIGQNDLFSQGSKKYDVIIANPPYVRTQNLGAEFSKRLAQKFNLSGRTDLYHAFLVGISNVLKPGGITGVITSNRFMTTQSGAAVRRALISEYDILHIWDLGDTQLFEAAVLPCVLLLKKKDEVVWNLISVFQYLLMLSLTERNKGGNFKIIQNFNALSRTLQTN